MTHSIALPPECETYLDLATQIAKKAAELIVAMRKKGFATTIKADFSPVTEVDQAAERLILAALREATPGIPAIGEEELAQGATAEPAETYWLVDPLDGTREFTAGRDEFTVNIGLVHRAQAVLGAVALPAFNATYSGVIGQGAWRHDDTGCHQIHVAPASSKGLRVVASRHYADDPKLREVLHNKPVLSLQSIGSAVKFIRVAEGAADFYPRLGPTMEWDTAAPQAIVEAAGGRVICFDGSPLRYGKPSWINPSFYCEAQPTPGYPPENPPSGNPSAEKPSL